jgi:hypothetical protein
MLEFIFAILAFLKSIEILSGRAYSLENKKHLKP